MIFVRRAGRECSLEVLQDEQGTVLMTTVGNAKVLSGGARNPDER